MTRVEMADDWQAALTADMSAGARKLFGSHLGPAILSDAKRYAPVDTGRLERSLDFDVVDGQDGPLPELVVGSFPDAEGPLPYVLATEFGFHGMEAVRAYVTRAGRRVRAHARRGNTPEQPFLRPALYQERDI